MKLLNVDALGCLRMYIIISQVVVNTTKLTCHYFVAIPPFIYCLDPKSALTAFS